jgi:nitronate monooxygenase
MRDLLRTPLCDLLGLDVPVVQGPIGSAALPELVAAVSEAGALGMLSVTWVPDEQVGGRVNAVRARTDRPFGVNTVLAFDIATRSMLP